jgi:hypothetical protein
MSTDWNAMSDEAFREAVRSDIEANYPSALRYPSRRMRWHEVKEWHLRQAQRGWTAPGWPTQYGGVGLSPVLRCAAGDDLRRYQRDSAQHPGEASPAASRMSDRTRRDNGGERGGSPGRRVRQGSRPSVSRGSSRTTPTCLGCARIWPVPGGWASAPRWRVGEDRTRAGREEHKRAGCAGETGPVADASPSYTEEWSGDYR